MKFNNLHYTLMASLTILPIIAMEQKPEPNQTIATEIKEESEKYWFDCLSELNPQLADQLIKLLEINPTLKYILDIKQSDVENFFKLNPTLLNLLLNPQVANVLTQYMTNIQTKNKTNI